MIYWVVYIALVVLVLIEQYSNFKDYIYIYNTLFSFLFILLLFTSGLRNGVGPDWYSYKDIFDYLNFNNIKNYPFEKGFGYLVIFLKYICNDFSFFVFIIALISLFLKFLFISKYSPFLFLSVLIYVANQFIIQDFGQIRQGLAIGFTLWAYYYASKNDYVRYFTLVIIAFLIHFTAIVFILPFFLRNIRISNFLSFFLILTSFILGVSFSLYLPYFLHFFDFNEAITYKIQQYLASTQYGYGLGVYIGQLFKIFILLLIMKIRDQKKELNFLFNIYLLGLIFLFLFNSIAIFSARIALYFVVFEIIALPYIISYLENNFFKFAVIFLVLVYTSRIYWYSIYDFYNVYMPYKSSIYKIIDKIL